MIMIIELCQNVEVREAGKKGRGLFATRQLIKGALIQNSGGILIPKSKIDLPNLISFKKYSFQVDKKLYLYPLPDTQNKLDQSWFINHSCDPNCGIHDLIHYEAIRNILPGEELTIDYAMVDYDRDGTDADLTEFMDCLCGSENCRRIITGLDWMRPDLQERYKGYFSDFIQKMIDQFRSDSDFRDILP